MRAMRTVTAPRRGRQVEPHPVPLTRAWVEDYRRYFDEQLRAPAVLAEVCELSALCGLASGLVGRLKAVDLGSCHCGRPGAFIEQRANGCVWYCLDHRPDFRACHICAQPGIAFEYAGERWLWYCRAHVTG
jgi:hypothetical protein